jgi:probable HAF family extracellular repeat protein
MTSTKLARISFMTILIALCAAPVNAQGTPPQNYKVIDLGTLGGSLSIAFGINDRGFVEGFSTVPGDASLHAFVWHDGVMVDLRTLGGPNSQAIFGPNESVQVAGVSETSTPDPYGEDFCGFGTHLICVPFFWQAGIMKPLDTLGGNNGQGQDINNRGEIAGWAETKTPDPFCPAPQILQFKPAIWKNSEIKKLRTFPGDLEGVAFSLNDQGQAVGASGACAAFDPDYGVPLQPQHALLWEQGKIVNLGSLGGTVNNAAFVINNAGQVGGTSGLPGNSINHAFLWQNGHITDLGTLPGDIDSGALGVGGNQVVGASFDASGNSRAFLWESGAMFDLNALISSGAPLFLLQASAINSRGEIVGFALETDTGNIHAFLAIPNHISIAPEETGRLGRTPKVVLPEKVRKLLQGRLRFGRFGTRAGVRNESN